MNTSYSLFYGNLMKLLSYLLISIFIAALSCEPHAKFKQDKFDYDTYKGYKAFAPGNANPIIENPNNYFDFKDEDEDKLTDTRILEDLRYYLSPDGRLSIGDGLFNVISEFIVYFYRGGVKGFKFSNTSEKAKDDRKLNAIAQSLIYATESIQTTEQYNTMLSLYKDSDFTGKSDIVKAHIVNCRDLLTAAGQRMIPLSDNDVVKDPTADRGVSINKLLKPFDNTFLKSLVEAGQLPSTFYLHQDLEIFRDGFKNTHGLTPTEKPFDYRGARYIREILDRWYKKGVPYDDFMSLSKHVGGAVEPDQIPNDIIRFFTILDSSNISKKIESLSAGEFSKVMFYVLDMAIPVRRDLNKASHKRTAIFERAAKLLKGWYEFDLKRPFDRIFDLGQFMDQFPDMDDIHMPFCDAFYNERPEFKGIMTLPMDAKAKILKEYKRITKGLWSNDAFKKFASDETKKKWIELHPASDGGYSKHRLEEFVAYLQSIDS